MINSNYLSTPGLKDFQGSRNPVTVAWDITDPTFDIYNPLFKDGDYGIYLPTGTPLLPETRPLVYRFKKDVPIVPSSGGTLNMWLPPNVYAGNPEVLAYLIGTESFLGLLDQGWSPTPIGLGGSISSVGGWIRLNSPSSLDAAGLICTEPILFSEEFYFRGEVRGQYALNNTVEAGFFHTLPPGVTPTQFALGKITTQNSIYNLVRGTGTWATLPTGATNKAGVVFEPNNTWSMEFNSYDRTTTSTRLLYSTTINGVTYSTARRGTAANVASDPFNLDIRVTSGVVGTPTRIDLKNFFVLRW
jgi:hypothetical protein